MIIETGFRGRLIGPTRDRYSSLNSSFIKGFYNPRFVLFERMEIRTRLSSKKSPPFQTDGFINFNSKLVSILGEDRAFAWSFRILTPILSLLDDASTRFRPNDDPNVTQRNLKLPSARNNVTHSNTGSTPSTCRHSLSRMPQRVISHLSLSRKRDRESLCLRVYNDQRRSLAPTRIVTKKKRRKRNDRVKSIWFMNVSRRSIASWNKVFT